MKQFSDDQIRMAFALWYPNYGHADADKAVAPFLGIPSDVHLLSQLKCARLALLLSASEVASRLGIDRSAYSRFESAEESGKIKIETLAKAAEAMDCELIYAIRPKSHRRFSEIVWEQLVEDVISSGRINPIWPDHIRIRNLASTARDFLQNSKFRSKMKWSERWRTKV